MEIRRIAIIGAGAVGAYFIYGFSGMEDVDFCLVAEGERAERLKKEGVIINDRVYRPAVKTPTEAQGADLVLVCTKYQGLTEVLEGIRTIVDDHTAVMSLLNGIDSEEIIAGVIGEEHLVYSVMRISSERREGRICFNPGNTVGVTLGEKGIAQPSERVRAIDSLMHRAGLHCTIKEDILMDQWEKYSMNIIYNLPQAVLGVGFGAYYDSEHVAFLRDRMFEEVSAVAQAEGIPLTRQGSWRAACTDKARFSTLQDLDAGRETEVDMFTGALIRLAQKHKIPVPFCEYTHHAIKALEEKNAGRFRY